MTGRFSGAEISLELFILLLSITASIDGAMVDISCKSGILGQRVAKGAPWPLLSQSDTLVAALVFFVICGGLLTSAWPSIE